MQLQIGMQRIQMIKSSWGALSPIKEMSWQHSLATHFMRVMSFVPQENMLNVKSLQLTVMAKCIVNHLDTMVEISQITTVVHRTQAQVIPMDAIALLKYPNHRPNQDMSKQIYSSLVEV